MTKQEYLAMSIPYDLMVCTEKYPTMNIMTTMVKDFIWVADEHYNKIGWTQAHGDKIEGIKPYLRPLSDMAKPMVDGDKEIIPFIEIVKLIYGDGDFKIYDENGFIEAETTWGSIIGMNYKKEIELYSYDIDSQENFPIRNQFKLYQKLVEWHFDIAGLIEKGEAIDINKINPYK